MFYYYAHTSHRGNLDSLRRGVAFIKELEKQETKVTLLVNDFRAGIVAKELGLNDVLNMETISDIDLVLEYGDRLLIDSSEELPLQFASFCRDYIVYRVARDCEDIAIHNETMIYPWISQTNQAIFVDSAYTENFPKEQRVLYFFGDSDSKKIIAQNAEFFKANTMDLLLGHYFYFQYESEIEPLFSKIHEAEDYIELIKTSSHIVTSSLQCALESSVAGAKTIFISIDELNDCQIELLRDFDIDIVDGFHKLNVLDTSKKDIDNSHEHKNLNDLSLFIS